MLACDVIFTALDFETTGHVRNQPCLPWQLGMVESKSSQILRTYSTYLKVPKEQRFNQYTPGRWAEIRDVLAESQKLTEKWDELSQWLCGRCLVSHNAPVERTIIQEAFPLHSFPYWIDTLRIAKKAFPKQPSYALGDLLALLNLTATVERQCPGLAPHDALYDAVGCMTLLNYILKLDGWNNLSCDFLTKI